MGGAAALFIFPFLNSTFPMAAFYGASAQLGMIFFLFLSFFLNRDSDKKEIDPRGEKSDGGGAGEKPAGTSWSWVRRDGLALVLRVGGMKDRKLPLALKAACRSASKSAFIPPE